jgi:hypothetical protein
MGEQVLTTKSEVVGSQRVMTWFKMLTQKFMNDNASKFLKTFV